MDSNALEWDFCPEESKRLARNVWCRKGSVSVIIAFMRLCPEIVSLCIAGGDFYRIILRMINRHGVSDDDIGDGIDDDIRNQARELTFVGMSCTPRELHFHPNSNKSQFNHLFTISQQSSYRDWASFAAGFLGGITHIFLPPVNYQRVNRFVQRFPCLTHLAIPYTSTNINQLSDLRPLLCLPNLQMLVLAVAMYRYTTYAFWFAECWVRTARRDGFRVYLVQYAFNDDDARIQWEEDMRGGASVWERAVDHTEDWEMVR